MAQLLLLVLCVKKAFCVKYTDFHCLCRPISLVYACRTSCRKATKKQEVNTMRHGVHLLLVCNWKSVM